MDIQEIRHGMETLRHYHERVIVERYAERAAVLHVRGASFTHCLKLAYSSRPSAALLISEPAGCFIPLLAWKPLVGVGSPCATDPLRSLPLHQSYEPSG